MNQRAQKFAKPNRVVTRDFTPQRRALPLRPLELDFSAFLNNSQAMSAPAVEASSPGRLSTSVGQKRERKRELDRICQQRKRKRDRENVQKLEAKLQSLRQKADDKTVYEILMVREKDQARMARHKKRMHQIQDLLQADLIDLSDDDGAIILAYVMNPAKCVFRDHG